MVGELCFLETFKGEELKGYGWRTVFSGEFQGRRIEGIWLENCVFWRISREKKCLILIRV
jgi:hypothetical protein